MLPDGISGATGLALPGYAVYAATKSTVKELRGRDITVNAVAPGPTATDLVLYGKTPEQTAHLSKIAPLERPGQLGGVAAVVSFLAGTDAAWVNGQTLRAKGDGLICFMLLELSICGFFMHQVRKLDLFPDFQS